VLTGPPPLVVFDPAAPPTRVTSNLKRDNSVLLYEMKIFICEECIKHGFLGLEELHFEFCDRLPMKHWREKLNEFLKECVLTQLIQEVSDIQFGVDCVGSHKHPYEHNYGGKGGIYYHCPMWLTYG